MLTMYGYGLSRYLCMCILDYFVIPNIHVPGPKVNSKHDIWPLLWIEFVVMFMFKTCLTLA